MFGEVFGWIYTIWSLSKNFRMGLRVDIHGLGRFDLYLCWEGVASPIVSLDSFAHSSTNHLITSGIVVERHLTFQHPPSIIILKPSFLVPAKRNTLRVPACCHKTSLVWRPSHRRLDCHFPHHLQSGLNIATLAMAVPIFAYRLSNWSIYTIISG